MCSKIEGIWDLIRERLSPAKQGLNDPRELMFRRPPPPVPTGTRGAVPLNSDEATDGR